MLSTSCALEHSKLCYIPTTKVALMYSLPPLALQLEIGHEKTELLNF